MATSNTIFWVFGMTRPGIETWSPEPLANTLLIRPIARYSTYSLDIVKQYNPIWVLNVKFMIHVNIYK